MKTVMVEDRSDCACVVAVMHTVEVTHTVRYRTVAEMRGRRATRMVDLTPVAVTRCCCAGLAGINSY